MRTGFDGFDDGAAWAVRVGWYEDRESHWLTFKRQGPDDRAPVKIEAPKPPLLTDEAVTNTPGGLRVALTQYVAAFLAEFRMRRSRSAKKTRKR